MIAHSRAIKLQKMQKCKKIAVIDTHYIHITVLQNAELFTNFISNVRETQKKIVRK